eukprot:TRINITY_DN14171_c0_g2_i1.p1 TRINITY_DN14171_c0_g2~~TRINITY_DN14171_c0_g2_i1.p1  ORF type:complete len:390 (-),score=55.98 TRINITY_DN14171_c0_g2_i1:389-1558(-)
MTSATESLLAGQFPEIECQQEDILTKQSLTPIHTYAHDPELVKSQHFLLELTHMHCLSACVFSATKLGIADIISDAGKPLTAGEIVEKLPDKVGHADYIWRVLRLLAAHGIFTESGENELEKATYGMTKTSQLLQRHKPGVPSMADYVLSQAAPTALQASNQLSDVLLRGGEPFAMANGANQWDYGRKHPEYAAQFGRAMTGISEESLAALLTQYDGFRQGKGLLVDVAGSTGLTGAAIHAHNPNIRVINLDLPEIVAQAPKFEGVTHVAGNMFEPIPVEEPVDFIFMKHIMHDWDDADCLKILCSCHKALSPEGRLVIADAVIHPLEASDERAKRIRLNDILMLIMCDRGRERSENEWRNLLEAASLKLVKIVRTSASVLSVLEAVKS